MRPIQLLSRQQPRLAALEPRLDAVAVEFDLVEPVRPVWRSVVQSSEAGPHEIRKPVATPTGGYGIGTTPYSNRRNRLCRRFRFATAPAGLVRAAACFSRGPGLRLQLGAEFALALRLCVRGWLIGLTV